KDFFNGLYCCAFCDSHLDRKSWRKWCYWGAQSQFQTLGTALLRLIGEILSQEMPNCVGVQVPVKKEGKLSRYETLAKRLDCVALKSVFPIGLEYLCDPERSLLVRYSDGEQCKVLVYSQTLAEVEKLAEFWNIEWKRREGKKIIDPAAFIQSTVPVTFVEKLEEMSQALLGNQPLALPLDEIEKAEARMGIRFPDALREFYLRFGKGGRLMSDSMHTVLMPKDLDPKNSNFGEDIAEALKKGSLLLAIENQGVWTMYLDIQTGEPWLDWGEGRQDCWGLNLEETLLNLLAMNALEFLPQAAECEMADTPENRELLCKFFHFLVEGKMAVFVNPERGVVCFREGDDDYIYIAAHKESEMNKLEADIDLQLSRL
ncbi:MAG: SMI1/KNR4 family protein, partial [Lachnospiraceae bacterium]|nr:SMI1/KNR4 family protein [Lachnospiraceae bacterium]